MLRSQLRRHSMAGATFVEALAVTIVIAGVLAAMGSSFVVGLKSYVGEYTSEARQLEVQRAFAEMRYFGTKCFRFETEGGEVAGRGDTVIFYYPDDTEAKFVFSETSMLDGDRVGTLTVTTPWGAVYTYGSHVMVTGYPFQVSAGGLAFRFFVDSGGGDVSLVGLIYPALVL